MKKKLALLISAAMILSVFSSCGESGGTDSANIDTTSGSRSSVTESAAEIIDFFDEDYDPFSDDYDPYGGGGASAASRIPKQIRRAECRTVQMKMQTSPQITAETPQKRQSLRQIIIRHKQQRQSHKIEAITAISRVHLPKLRLPSPKKRNRKAPMTLYLQ